MSGVTRPGEWWRAVVNQVVNGVGPGVDKRGERSWEHRPRFPSGKGKLEAVRGGGGTPKPTT